MAFAFAFMFVLSFGAINPTYVMADEEISEEAATLQETITGMLSQFNAEADVDSYISNMVTQYEQYYGEGAGDGVKEMYAFLYDWVKIKKEVGEYKSVKDLSYEEDEETASVKSLTMEIECEKGGITLNYTATEESMNITIEKKASFGELMKNAGLNTLLGMGTVFAVLVLISLLISCFKFISKPEGQTKAKATVESVAPAAAPVAKTEDVDVTDDLELVAVISAAIAAAEGTSTEGFRVRSIKRVRRSNW